MYGDFGSALFYAFLACLALGVIAGLIVGGLRLLKTKKKEDELRGLKQENSKAQIIWGFVLRVSGLVVCCLILFLCFWVFSIYPIGGLLTLGVILVGGLIAFGLLMLFWNMAKSATSLLKK